MLEANCATGSQTPENQSFEPTAEQLYAVQEFMYGDTDIPFIYFFKHSFISGMFKDLGDIERLKKNNPTFASYIDRWLTAAIEYKIIKVKTDGVVEVDRGLLDKVDHNNITSNMTLLKKNKEIAKQTTEEAIKGLQNKNKFSSVNNFIFYNDDETYRKVVSLYNNFLNELGSLSNKRFNIQNTNNPGKVRCISLASCEITEEVLNEI